jgi:hypothetical protein
MELPHALHQATAVELKERIEAERRQRPFLLFRDADGRQRIVDLGDAPARLIDDGRSHNGSFIDGERVHGRTRLRDGDAIGLGRTFIVFRSPAGRESLRTATSQQHVVPAITAAQRRVLVALCRPYEDSSFAAPASNRQIAGELVIGIETVKTHMSSLFEAFSLRDLPQYRKRTALAQRAIEIGLVTPRPTAARSHPATGPHEPT